MKLIWVMFWKCPAGLFPLLLNGDWKSQLLCYLPTSQLAAAAAQLNYVEENHIDFQARWLALPVWHNLFARAQHFAAVSRTLECELLVRVRYVKMVKIHHIFQITSRNMCALRLCLLVQVTIEVFVPKFVFDKILTRLNTSTILPLKNVHIY